MSNCMYCERGEKLHSLMAYICDVDGFGLYMNRNQTHRGRVVRVCDEHIPTIAAMPQKKAERFFAAVHRVVCALEKAYNPDQINIGMYGDTVTHVHCHIVPKYEGGVDWNNVFQMNPQPPTVPSELELEATAERLRRLL